MVFELLVTTTLSWDFSHCPACFVAPAQPLSYMHPLHYTRLRLALSACTVRMAPQPWLDGFVRIMRRLALVPSHPAGSSGVSEVGICTVAISYSLVRWLLLQASYAGWSALAVLAKGIPARP